MKRFSFVSFAIAMSLLLATAPAASAINTSELSVGSKHTTDTEFNNATTLTNMSVSGSGTAATLQYQSQQVYDGFESGTLDAAYGGDTDGATVQSSVVKDGTYALRLDGAKWNTISRTDISIQRDETVTGWVRLNRIGAPSNWDAGAIFMTQENDDTPGGYLVDMDGDDNTVYLKTLDGSGGNTEIDSASLTISEDTWYQISFEAQSGGTVVAEVYDSSGSLLATASGSDSTYSSGGIGFEHSGDTDEFEGYFDRLAQGERQTTAEYVSQNHSVSRAEQARVNVDTAVDVNGDLTARYYDGSSWVTISNSTSFSTAGNHTVDLPDVSASKWRVRVSAAESGTSANLSIQSESVLFESVSPTVNNSSASPTGDIDSATVDLSINLNDTDFGTGQGDSVNVDFQVKKPNESAFSTVGTDTITSNSTAELGYEPAVGGEYQWKVSATDSYGNSVGSETFNFTSPANLVVRDENTLSRITGANASVKFYTSEKIYERSDDNNDGNISFVGLPTNTEFVANVNADNYTSRRVLIRSLNEQQSVYLSPENESQQVNLTFTLDDQTGQFPPSDTKLLIQRGINESGSVEYKTISGDYMGAANQFPATLDQETRYRLILETKDNSRRELGAFVPSESQEGALVTLTVESGIIPLQEGETYDWDVTYTDAQNSADIEFAYKSSNATDDLQVVVYERDNAANEIYNQTVASTADDKRTISLNATEANMTWVVEWSGELDGEDIGGQRVVGDDALAVGIPLSDTWANVFSVIGMLIFGGLFGGLRSELGGVAISAAGAVFLFLGWLPAAIGGLAIAGGFALSAIVVVGTGGVGR